MGPAARVLLALLGACLVSPVTVLAEEPPAPRPPESGEGPAPRVPGAGDIVSISGRVVSDSGNPLPEGLEVRAEGRLREGHEHGEPIRVGEDGAFTIENLLNGQAYRIEAGHLGGVAHALLGTAEKVAAGTKDLVITLATMNTIQGVVLDAEGNPVGPGVRVHAMVSREGPGCGNRFTGEFSSARTRKDGTFLLEYLGEGCFDVSTSGRGKSGPEGAGAFWIPHGSRGVVLLLGPLKYGTGERPFRREPSPHEPAPMAITGSLPLREGTEAPDGIHIKVIPDRGGEGRHVYVSPKGVFDTGALPPGNYTLQVGTSWLDVGTRTGVKAGTRDLSIPLHPHGTIAGRVIDSAGRPAGAGAEVVARFTGGTERVSSARTAEDGTFLVEYLGDREFTISARPCHAAGQGEVSDLSSRIVKGLRPGVKGLALYLLAPASVSGTVLSADGTPCPPFTLMAVQEGREGAWPADTHASGAFELRGLAAGKFRVIVSVKGKEYPLGDFEAPAEGLVLRIPAETR